jgi:RHS repeat-associated protein
MNRSMKDKPVSLLALTAALVIPALLPQSARGMYDPKHGRWLQRDPAGMRGAPLDDSVQPSKQVEDGMNLYQYVRSRPSMSLDPEGLYVEIWNPFNYVSAPWLKGQSINRLSAENHRLSRYDYAKEFGITGGISRALSALRNIWNWPWPRWHMGSPRFHQGDIWLPSTNAQVVTILHEGIHAYHYQQGFYQRSLRQDEGVATAVADGIYLAARPFEWVEEQWGSGRCPDVARLRANWGSGWNLLDRVLEMAPSLFPNDVINWSDLYNARVSLGIAVSCRNLADKYNSRLRQLPLRCFPCHCYRFVCRRPRPFLRGLFEIGTQHEVRVEYEGSDFLGDSP